MGEEFVVPVVQEDDRAEFLTPGDLIMLQHHLDLDQLYCLYWVLQMLGLGREIILLHIAIKDLVVNSVEVKHLLLRE